MSRPWLNFLWLFVAYFLTGYLGLSLPAIGTQITLIWLPTGISVGWYYRWGYRYWPAVFLAASALNLLFGSQLSLALAIAAGNTAAPLVVAWLLRHMRFQPTLERWQDMALLALAAHLGMVISASNGILAIAYFGGEIDSFAIAWFCWWMGDSLGVIIAAPLLLVTSRTQLTRIWRRWIEVAIWLSVTFTVTWAVFVLNHNDGEPAYALAFVPLPLIAWATLRFGATGTSLAIILLSSVAVWGTAHQTGMFSRSQPIEQLLLIAAYMATTISLGWMIAALHFAQVKAIDTQRILEEALCEASMGVLLTDREKQVTYTNAGFTRLTGFTPKEMIGKNLCSIFGEHDNAEAHVESRSNLATTGHFDRESLNYRKDGTPFWSAMILMPLLSSHGEKSGFLCIQRDVTERKMAEDELRASDARYRHLFQANPHPMWVYDLETLAFLAVNEAAVLHYGYSREEFLAMTIRDIRPPHDIPALLNSVDHVPEGIEKSGIWRHRLRSGALIEVEITSHVVRFDDRPADLVLANDVTERRRIEERLRASLREKTSMLKEIHHRVKNNLQIISSLLNLQAEQVVDPVTLSALRESQNRVRSMSLVHETLYQTDNFGCIDMTEYLSALSRHLFRSYGVDPARIRINVQVNGLSLNLDQAMPFGLIINELVTNSLKYAFPGDRTGQICIELRSPRRDCHVFVISDDGIGLPEGINLKTLKTLGLQLVHDLVRQLMGTLTIVESPKLEFMICVPMEVTQQETMV